MLNLRIYPDPVLRQKCEEVNPEGDLNLIFERMEEIMKEKEGVGFSAPQIGILKRLIVVKMNDEFIRLVNPEIIEGEGEEICEEGCLSLPDVYLEIKRYQRVKVRGFTPEGVEREIIAEGLSARAFQHEIDHLNGILIIDRIPTEEKIDILMTYKYKAGTT